MQTQVESVSDKITDPKVLGDYLAWLYDRQSVSHTMIYGRSLPVFAKDSLTQILSETDLKKVMGIADRISRKNATFKSFIVQLHKELSHFLIRYFCGSHARLAFKSKDGIIVGQKGRYKRLLVLHNEICAALMNNAEYDCVEYINACIQLIKFRHIKEVLASSGCIDFSETASRSNQVAIEIRHLKQLAQKALRPYTKEKSCAMV